MRSAAVPINPPLPSGENMRREAEVLRKFTDRIFRRARLDFMWTLRRTLAFMSRNPSRNRSRIVTSTKLAPAGSATGTRNSFRRQRCCSSNGTCSANPGSGLRQGHRRGAGSGGRHRSESGCLPKRRVAHRHRPQRSHARSRAPPRRATRADRHPATGRRSRLPFDNGSFDTVVCTFVAMRDPRLHQSHRRDEAGSATPRATHPCRPHRGLLQDPRVVQRGRKSSPCR